MSYVLITDGSFSSCRNQGGIGLVFLRNDKVILEYSKMYKNVTNNIMEVLAIIIGFKAIKRPIDSLHIVSDSQYALGVMFRGWKRNKNRKLLEVFDKEYMRVQKLCPSITYEHIRGHGKGNPTKWDVYQDKCDKLAVKASQQL